MSRFGYLAAKSDTSADASLSVPELMATLTTYRDVGGFWTNRNELFDEKTKVLETWVDGVTCLGTKPSRTASYWRSLINGQPHVRCGGSVGARSLNPAAGSAVNYRAARSALSRRSPAESSGPNQREP